MLVFHKFWLQHIDKKGKSWYILTWTRLINIIIHQTHYQKSDWSRAFNQFTIACELAADIAFIMSSSMSAWLLSPLECSPQKQNGWTLRFCFWGWIMWKMYNETIIEFGFRMISCSTSSNTCLIIIIIIIIIIINECRRCIWIVSHSLLFLWGEEDQSGVITSMMMMMHKWYHRRVLPI